MGTRTPSTTTITMTGSSVIVVVLGVLVPIILASYSWRWSWWICAAFVFVVAVICRFLLVDTPTEKGLTPVGLTLEGNKKRLLDSLRQHSHKNLEQIEPKVTVGDILKRGTVWNLSGIYFTWGVGYATFSTFAVTYLREIGWAVKAAAGVFAMWGALHLVGHIVWGIAADRLTKKYLLVTALALESIGMLIFLSGSTVGCYVGAGLVGFGHTGISTTVPASMADYYEPKVIGTTYGFITLIFGIAAIIAPTVGGVLGDATGTLSSAILFSLGVLILGVVLALVLKRPAKR